MNLGGSAQPKPPRQKKEKMQVDQQFVRKQPERAHAKEKINYNEVKLSEQLINQQRQSIEEAEVRAKKAKKEETKMDVD